MPQPTVTVGVFCFNQARFLRDSLAGLLAQDHRPYDVVLVDDGSSDASVAALHRAAEQLSREVPTTVIAEGENRGLPARMNEVTERAAGDWVVWVAADDSLLPRGLSHLMSGATRDVDVVFADLAVMDEHGRSKGYRRPGQTWQRYAARQFLDPGDPAALIMRFNNFVSGCAPAIRTTALRAAGGYRPGIRIEDLDMWLELAGRGSKFRYIPEAVARYRVVAGSHSRSEDVAVRDLALLVAHHVAEGRLDRKGLARLVAMRWSLSVARTRGRPPMSLADAARLAMLPERQVAAELPSATVDPVLCSARAALARLSAKF